MNIFIAIMCIILSYNILCLITEIIIWRIGIDWFDLADIDDYYQDLYGDDEWDIFHR